MKTQDEIQRAHDQLSSIIIGECPNPCNPEKPFKGESLEERCLVEQCAVLCWILGHDHNATFGKNLATLDAWLAERGFVLERTDQ